MNFILLLRKTLKDYKADILVVLLLLVVAGFFRLYQLDYSHFYGDETKILYLRKDISAQDFIFNQRKGPVQYLVAWTSEKISGGFSELWIRLPFSIASVFSVVALYFLLRTYFLRQSAFIISLIFSLNGFFIAFGRTAQYQSFLILFGFLAIFFIRLYYLYEKKWLLILGGLFLGVAFLTHYDAIFFSMPVMFICFQCLAKNRSKFVKELAINYVPIFLIIVCSFYIPYIFNNYFQNQALDYVLRRISGDRYLQNNSFYTFGVYNPTIISKLVFLGIVPAFLDFKKFKEFILLMIFWFIFPFIVFEVIFSNPGTHILNYILPLVLISGLGLGTLYAENLFNKFVVVTILVLNIFLMAQIYIPKFSTGYPWKDSKVFGFQISEISRDFHLFLYGFPYNRDWQLVSKYHKENGIRSFYTNDNLVMASFYLYGVFAVEPKDNQVPHYYIYVKDNFEHNKKIPERIHGETVLENSNIKLIKVK